jgi:DICT domain-containing protein
VGVAALRAWERRHGFPRPERLPGGHRRYSEAEVERIARVVAERARGRSVESAIDEVRRASPGEGASLHAALRRQRPDLPVHLLSRRAMLAVSRAIEDEAAALGEAPLLVGAFQREAAYRAAAPRWEDLARTAGLAVVFADFADRRGRLRRPEGGVVEVPLPLASPLRREWAVVCDGPSFGACLAGCERPGAAARGRFEAVWSVEPEVVRRAAQLAVDLARRHGADVPPGAVPVPAPPPGGPVTVARWATAVTNRIVEYLDR